MFRILYVIVVMENINDVKCKNERQNSTKNYSCYGYL